MPLRLSHLVLIVGSECSEVSNCVVVLDVVGLSTRSTIQELWEAVAISAIMAYFTVNKPNLLLSYSEITFVISSSISDEENLIMSLGQSRLQRRGKLSRHVLCMTGYSLKFNTTWSKPFQVHSAPRHTSLD